MRAPYASRESSPDALAPRGGTSAASGWVALLQRAPRYAKLAARFAAAIDALPFLRQRATRRRGRARGWEIDPQFDAAYHLRWEPIAADADLLPTASERLATPLSPLHPPWELHVLAGPTRSLVLAKVGGASPDARRAELGAALLDALTRGPLRRGVRAPAVPRAAAPTAPAKRPNVAADIVLDVLREVQRGAGRRREAAATLVVAATDLATSEPARESLRGLARATALTPIGFAAAALESARSLGSAVAERLTATDPSALQPDTSSARSLALVDLPAAALDCMQLPLRLDVGDMLLSIASGALSRLSPGDGLVPRAWRARVALPGRADAGVLLPTDEADPLRRALQIHLLCDAAAREAGAARGSADAKAAPRRWAATGRPVAADCDVKLRVEGPAIAAATLAGAPILRLYPLAAPGAGGALAIGAQRFDRWLALGITCDARVAPAPRELARALRDASDELFAAAHQPPPFTPPPATATGPR